MPLWGLYICLSLSCNGSYITLCVFSSAAISVGKVMTDSIVVFDGFVNGNICSKPAEGVLFIPTSLFQSLKCPCEIMFIRIHF